MKNVLLKIDKARKLIKESELKKLGHNNHSNYDYYTPEQVSKLVNDSCSNVKIMNTYELLRTELGLIARVTVWDLESDESMVFNMATEIPSITATNIAQQLGGAVTYSERYLLMSIYDIKDNNLDFDNKNGHEPENSRNESNFEARDITIKEVENKWNGKIYKGSVYIDEKRIVPSKEQIEKLMKHPKYIKS